MLREHRAIFSCDCNKIMLFTNGLKMSQRLTLQNNFILKHFRQCVLLDAASNKIKSKESYFKDNLEIKT